MRLAILAKADAAVATYSAYRRFALALVVFTALPIVLLALFVVIVDPYYIFGSPGWRGFNKVRPYYEPHVLTAKPYQVRRIRPDAVALGSSTAEVGIDPRHPGWIGGRVFNFAMPASTIYELYLAFTHAQAVGRPLKQAVLGLDFFGFNIFFFRNREVQEARFAGDGVEAFAEFLAPELKSRSADIRTGSTGDRREEPAWNEALYLAVNADVAAAITRKEFKSGREHYELAGRAEHREGAKIPSDWDEVGYLQVNPDVAYSASLGNFLGGYHHYLAAGRAEGRSGGFHPANWNEAAYLAANPSARIRVALGEYYNGYVHYLAVGRAQGAVDASSPDGLLDRVLDRPALIKAMFELGELWRAVFSTTAVQDSVTTVLRQSEPASFDGLGMRIWHGQDEVLRGMGGTGWLILDRLTGGGWGPIITPPRLMYCFTNGETGMTTFDPYRLLLRRAYAEGTDLRLFVSPFPAVVHELLVGLGLAGHYEFWLKELVRINEEEAARAGRPPLPLWDFSDVNAITREPIPKSDDATPMRWFWEYSHYRKATGDLILDRIFGHTEPSRTLPVDFGVRLTSASVGAHIARNKARLSDWAAANQIAAEIRTAARDPNAKHRQAEATCW